MQKATPLLITCPNCAADVEIEHAVGARDVWCPNCRTTFKLEAHSEPPPALEQPPEPPPAPRETFTIRKAQLRIEMGTAYSATRSTAFGIKLCGWLFGLGGLVASIGALDAPAGFAVAISLGATSVLTIVGGIVICQLMYIAADIADAHLATVADRWNARG